MLDYFKVLEQADLQYKRLKEEKYPFTAPELIPGIQSDQIRALAFVLVASINEELAAINAKLEKRR